MRRLLQGSRKEGHARVVRFCRRHMTAGDRHRIGYTKESACALLSCKAGVWLIQGVPTCSIVRLTPQKDPDFFDKNMIDANPAHNSCKTAAAAKSATCCMARCVGWCHQPLHDCAMLPAALDNILNTCSAARRRQVHTTNCAPHPAANLATNLYKKL